MNTKAAEPEPSIPDGMATAVRQQRERQLMRVASAPYLPLLGTLKACILPSIA